MKRKYLLTVPRQESMLTVSVFSNTSTERGLSENKCPLYCINTLHITRVFFNNVKRCILQLNLLIKEFISVLLLSNIILQTELIIHSEKDHDVRCAPRPPVLHHIHNFS